MTFATVNIKIRHSLNWRETHKDHIYYNMKNRKKMELVTELEKSINKFLLKYFISLCSCLLLYIALSRLRQCFLKHTVQISELFHNPIFPMPIIQLNVVENEGL